MTSVTSAQKNLVKGYIITNQFDTINGLIDFRGDLLNSSRCVFYLDQMSKPVNYLPGEIFAYRYEENGRFYISKIVKLNSGEKTVFLEYLVNGITNLYYLRDKSGDHYFIEKGNTIHELTNNTTTISQDNKTYTKKSNFYVGQMKLIYGDEERLMPSIDGTKFERESMMKLSEEYHNLVCKDSACIIYEKKTRNLILHAGPVASFRWSDYTFPTYILGQSTFTSIMARFNFKTTHSAYLGIAASAKFPTISDKFVVRLKGIYGKESNNGTYSESSLTQRTDHYFQYEKRRIITSLDLRYEYPRGLIRPTLVVGGELAIITGQNTFYEKNIFNTDGELIETETSDHLIRFNSTGGIFGAAGFTVPVKRSYINLECFYSKSWGYYQYSLKYDRPTEPLWSYAKCRESSLGISLSFMF